MLVDCGFWNAQGEYVEDYQEINEMELEEYKISDYLKDEPELIELTIKNLREEINHLEQENARLKEENEALEKFLSDKPLALQALQKAYASYKQSSDVFYKDCIKYKQALEEIRGIAEHVINASNCSNCDGCGYYDGCQDDNCGDWAVRKIVDKIDEVLG